MGTPRNDVWWRRGLAAVVVIGWLVSQLGAQPSDPEIAPGEAPPLPVTEADSRPANVMPAHSVEAPNDPIGASIVKIFSTVRRPDVTKPWSRLPATESGGSGVILDGKRILTCAHVVANTTEVLVQANQSSERVAARVAFVAPGIDLALLVLEDESFFATHPALPLAGQPPALKSNVLTYGFPKGGTTLAITKGIISRVEFARYNSGVSGLRAQIDAPINPGNSGGPVLMGGKVVGLAFAGLTGAQNIGYIIPAEEIALFLADVKDGTYDGKPALLDRTQNLEQAALRAALSLPASLGGVLVTEPGSSAPDYPLHTGDVVTHVANVPLDQQGLVKVGDLRLRYTYLLQKHVSAGRVPMTLWREGREVRVNVPTTTDAGHLLADFSNRMPPYFVYGPLVFSVASAQFVAAQTAVTRQETARPIVSMLLTLASDRSPLLERLGDRPAFPGEEMVIVCARPLTHPLSRGMPNAIGQVLVTANGTKIRNLAHLVELLRDSTARHTTFVFGGKSGAVVVVPHVEALAATEEILADNSIRAVSSGEVLKIWQAKPPAALQPAAP